MTVAGSTFSQTGPDPCHVYVKPADTWRMRLAGAVQPANCSSSTRSIWAPVRVIVTRLLPNGWTVNDSPYVTFPSPSPAALDGVREVGPDPAGVHERDDGVAEPRVVRRVELCVGDDVAEGGLAGRVVGPADGGRDRADDAVGERRRDRVVRAMRAVWSAALSTSRVTITLLADARTMSPVVRLTIRSMSVTRRPNELPLVTSLSSMTQL